jgi:Uma2 family endonuclease
MRVVDKSATIHIALPVVSLPVRIRPERPFTDEELSEFCSANESFRIEQDEKGDLILMPPSGLEGVGAAAEVVAELKIWARQDGRGKSFGDSGGFSLPDGSMRSPCAAWMPWERWNDLNPKQRKRFGHVVPSFVVELRLGADSLPVFQKKMQKWIANGVEAAWLIDPQRRVVEVYRAGVVAEVHEDPDAVEGTGCVNGFRLVMERVWGG